jgi:hypothetical protein
MACGLNALMIIGENITTVLFVAGTLKAPV